MTENEHTRRIRLRRNKERAAALFIKRVCGTYTAAVFLRNLKWPLPRSLRLLAKP